METALKCIWSCATACGTRKIGRVVSKFSSYKDTAFFFEGVEGHVALSIDDGLSRGGSSTSLAGDVLELLQKHNAHCTFFVCSKYLENVQAEAAALIAAGNEFGNHLEEDKFGYSKLPEEQFEAALQSTTEAIESVPGAQVRWFRAPQGVFTSRMFRVTARKGLRHAIGDAYCDDWAISDGKWVAKMLLKQAKAGSIIIMHMPERGLREHTLEALSLLLDGLSSRGLKCLTLSEMESLAAATSSTAAVGVEKI